MQDNRLNKVKKALEVLLYVIILGSYVINIHDVLKRIDKIKKETEQ